MPHSSERSFYRIAYPPQSRATFLLGDHACSVCEISERGFRFEPNPAHVPELGDAIDGEIRLACGLAFDVEGTIMREQASSLVVLLAPPLPFSAIMEEQRYLRAHYPMRYDPESPDA